MAPKAGLAALIRPPAVALAVMASAAWLVWSGSRTIPEPAIEKASIAPERLGLWHGKSVGVGQRALDILETDDVALMEYQLGAEPPVWFARVAGFGNRAAFHPPEICYVGSHYEVLERGPITVRINGSDRRVMRLVVGQGAERSEAWYWFTVNDRVTPNYYQQQMWLALQAVRHEPTSGTLVRISTRMDDPASANRRLLAFLTSFDAASSPRQVAHGL